MATGRIILDYRPVLLLMGRFWFNCNWVFNKFEFIFSNPRRVQALLLPPRPDYILKIIFYYFILYFNINNNNN